MPKIEQLPRILTGSELTGRIPESYTKAQLIKILGFKPYGGDTAGKSKYTWDFTIDGKPCSIWDWKGDHWSCWDPHGVMKSVFPEYTPIEY